MRLIQTKYIFFTLIILMLNIVGCDVSTNPTVPSVQLQKKYVLMQTADAEKKAQDTLAALPADTRKFLKDFSGDLVPGMASGVKINGAEEVIIVATTQQMTITKADGTFGGIVYCLFFNTTDVEVVDAGGKHIIKKGIWAWGVSPTEISLMAMTESGNNVIIFDQPLEPFKQISQKFVPKLSAADQAFTITIADKQINFSLPTAQTSATTTPAETSLQVTPGSFSSALTSGTLSPFDNAAYPFAVGNSWTYSKTVAAGQDTQFWLKLNMKDGGTAELLLNDDSCKAGTYTETFSVVRQIDDHSWEIKETSSSDQCLGRYRDASQIIWSVEPESMPPDHFGKQIVEQISYNEWPPNWPINSAGSDLAEPFTHVQSLGYVMSGPETSLFQNTYAVAYTYYGAMSSKIDVPAGSLNNCSTMLGIFSKDISTQKDKTDLSRLESGWEEKISFCKGIGFAKFVQEDLKGNPVSTMELLEYHLAGQS